MKGMAGVIIVNDELRNTAVITQEIKSGEKYLVQFQNNPKFYRVVDLEVIQGWLLFADPAEMQTWIQANQTKPPAPAPVSGPVAAPTTKEKEEVRPNGEDQRPVEFSHELNANIEPVKSGKDKEFEDADLETGASPGPTKNHSEGTD